MLEHLGYERLNYFDACKYRNSLDDSIDARAVFEEYAASPYRAKGPVVVDSRYISEDVPQGLVMLESLGRHLSIPTPGVYRPHRDRLRRTGPRSAGRGPLHRALGRGEHPEGLCQLPPYVLIYELPDPH